MGAFIKRTVLGFSLLELMVVVAIIGVLATVAVPRFNIFRARTRQAEAKSNLGVIYTLQESFVTAHERYYDGVSGTWGGTDMHNENNRDGYRGSASGTVCRANKLGFRLANCSAARYGYWVGHGNDTEFLVIAYAPSDTATGKRIFPGCDGALTGRAAKDSTTAVRGVQCAHTGTNSNRTAASAGDAWCLDEDRAVHNYYDIVEGCEG